jgi:hypothetical protein
MIFNVSLALIALTLLVPQDSKTIVRQEKNDYNQAVAKCREGETLIEADPQQAIDRFTEILSMPKIRVVECILKIEQRPAEFSDPYGFFPYQYRGRAKMNLSKKAAPEAAQKIVASAIEDFQESAKRNVPSSGELLKGAESAMAKLRAEMTKPPEATSVDPVVKFRERWDPLMSQNRFKTARAAAEKEGDGLTAEIRKNFVQSTEQGCRDYLVKWVSAFRPTFISALAQGLDQKTSDEFDLLFSLPPTDELVVMNPAVEWVRQYVPAFRDVQAQKAPPSSLAAAAAAAAPLEERLENPWFKAVENAVFGSFKDALADLVKKSQDAPKAERQRARAQADALLSEWKAFTSKIDPKFIQRHKFVVDHENQLSKQLDGFPTDLADLDRLGPAIDAAFLSDTPDQEFAKIEDTLSGFEGRGNPARESRQRLYTLRVTVVALRGFYSGKAEDAVISDLSSFRQKLRDAGGPDGDVKKYGPRVEKVFSDLR